MSAQHWDDFFAERAIVPWHEPVPSTLELVVRHSNPRDGIVDVGGGASLLVAHLLELGYDDITIVDVSAVAIERSRTHAADTGSEVEWVAIERSRTHAADTGSEVEWIRHDITTLDPHRHWDLWHDRAVFHFLTDPAERAAYVDVAARAIPRGSTMIVSTFAPDGPEKCANLPVCRYGVDQLAAEFAPTFTLVEGLRLTPPSTEGDQRPYVGVVLRRR